MVAANSPEEAHGVMCANEHGHWLECNYEAAGWELLESVVANVEHPQILAENGYTE